MNSRHTTNKKSHFKCCTIAVALQKAAGETRDWRNRLRPVERLSRQR